MYARLGLCKMPRTAHFPDTCFAWIISTVDEEALNSFTTYTYKTPFQLQIEYPGSRNRDDRLTEEIRQDFSDFEKTLYSYDYDREKHGYTSMIDVDSFL